MTVRDDEAGWGHTLGAKADPGGVEVWRREGDERVALTFEWREWDQLVEWVTRARGLGG